MANPTTNYGWPMPTSTDLVTDLPADFAAFGQPVDTSLKALNPETTLGDIAYRSSTANTNTRLAIGSTGNVLTVAGGVPTWAAPATPSSGMTLITRNTFTAQSSVTIDSIFSSSYFTYLFNYKIFGSANSEVNLQGVYSGTVQTGSVTSSAYYGMDSGGNIRSNGRAGQASASLGNYQNAENYAAQGSLTWANVGNSSQIPLWTGTVNQSFCWATSIAGTIATAQTYTGVKLFATSGTISGYVEVYGLAKA